MPTPSQPSQTRNRLLEPLAAFIGNWKTTGSHPSLPGMTLHGSASFEWIDNGAFVKWSSRNDEGKIPKGTAIFGGDDTTGELVMLYFDDRNVARIYHFCFDGNKLHWWRNDPTFSQSFTFGMNDQHDTITSTGEMCTDGSNWEKDLALTYTLIK